MRAGPLSNDAIIARLNRDFVNGWVLRKDIMALAEGEGELAEFAEQALAHYGYPVDNQVYTQELAFCGNLPANARGALRVASFEALLDKVPARPAQDPARAPSHLLRLQPAAGRELHYLMHTVVTAGVGDARLPQNHFGVVVARSFEPGRDGAFTAIDRIDRIRGKSSIPNGGYDYDSDRDDDPPREFGPTTVVLGAVAEVSYDPRGRQGERKIDGKLAELEAQSGSDFLDTDTMLLDRLELPDGPVQVGDDWVGEPEQKGGATIARRYRLVAVEDGVARIRRDETLRYDDPAPHEVGNGATSHAWFRLDLKSGQVQSIELIARMRETLNGGGLEVNYVLQRRWRLLDGPSTGQPWPEWEAVPAELLPAAAVPADEGGR